MPDVIDSQLQYHEREAQRLRSQRKPAPVTLPERLADAQTKLNEFERRLRCRTADVEETLDQLAIARAKRDAVSPALAVMSDETRNDHRVVYSALVSRLEAELEKINKEVDELRVKESATRAAYDSIRREVDDDPIVVAAKRQQDVLIHEFGQVAFRTWQKNLLDMIPDVREAKSLQEKELRLVLETNARIGVTVMSSKLRDVLEKCVPTLTTDEDAFKAHLRSVRTFLVELGCNPKNL